MAIHLQTAGRSREQTGRRKGAVFIMQAVNKSEAAKPAGISTAAAFFCVLAAACATVRSALLLLEMSAVVLLLCAGLKRVLRPFTGRGTPVASAVFAAALAGVMHMALLAWRPLWWEELSLPLYYLAAFLAGALAAQERAWHEELLRFGWWALALLIIGGVREWLTDGRLMGVRLLWDGISADFGLGGLGVMLAALLLALFGLRQHWSWNYSIRESTQAGGLLFACTGIAGIAAYLLCRLDMAIWGETFWPALTLGAVLLVGRGIVRDSRRQDMLADPALAAAGYAALLIIREGTGIWWQTLLLILGTALLTGVLLAAFGAVAVRLDTPGLPARFKTSPVLLLCIGTALYAFSAF